MNDTDSQRGRLGGLLVAQFFGAFNDNAWKLLVTLLGIGYLKAELGPSSPKLEAESQAFTTLAFVVFTLPLMLFSVPAGLFADRLSKRSMILAMKVLEVMLMAAGSVALFMDPSASLPLLAILALMGMQSALFSPAKYGILPEILPHERLSAGNGALEMWTFFAIIAGSVAAGVLL
ncbi:MAG: MFS transporter, partial [Planctomycetota bacterium]